MPTLFLKPTKIWQQESGKFVDFKGMGRKNTQFSANKSP